MAEPTGLYWPSQTIVLKGDFERYEEAYPSVDVYPGYLIEQVNDNTVRPHSTANAKAQRMVAIEDGLLGRTISTVYATSVPDLVRYVRPDPGDKMLMVLKAGESVVRADPLKSAGDGTLAKATVPATDHIVAYAEQVLDLSGGGAVKSFVRVRMA